jgi:hypothetical protein
MHPQNPAVGPLKRRRTFVTFFMAGLLALPAVLGLATDAQATSARGQNFFGAIAVDRSDGTFGFSFDFSTRAAAERRALRECRIRSQTDLCRGIVWVRNGCASVAVRRRADGSLSRIAWGIGSSRAQAQRRALNKCQDDGRRCRVLAWTCTTR